MMYIQLDDDDYVVGYNSNKVPGGIEVDYGQPLNLKDYSYRLVSGELVSSTRINKAPQRPSILVEGLTFDSNANSISRIESAVMSLGDDDTIEWILHDNTVSTVSRSILQKVLLESIRVNTTFLVAARVLKDSLL